MKEITQRGDIILFIDALHNLVCACAAVVCASVPRARASVMKRETDICLGSSNECASTKSREAKRARSRL
jgi:hypothetical protein